MYNTNLSLSLSCAQVKSLSSTERMISLKAGGHKQHAESVGLSTKKYSDLHVLVELCNYDI